MLQTCRASQHRSCIWRPAATRRKASTNDERQGLVCWQSASSNREEGKRFLRLKHVLWLWNIDVSYRTSTHRRCSLYDVSDRRRRNDSIVFYPFSSSFPSLSKSIPYSCVCVCMCVCLVKMLVDCRRHTTSFFLHSLSVQHDINDSRRTPIVVVCLFFFIFVTFFSCPNAGRISTVTIGKYNKKKEKGKREKKMVPYSPSISFTPPNDWLEAVRYRRTDVEQCAHLRCLPYTVYKYQLLQ